VSGWKRRGSATIEMTLVGIPMIFTLISIFEISRGMWVYHTLAYSVKEGVRFGVVHGVNCINKPPGVTNNCPKNVSDVANVIKDAAVGLDADKTLLTLSTSGDVTRCYLGSSSGTNIAGPFGSHVGCLSLTGTQWPPDGDNAVGQQIQIDIRTPFRSAIAILWPGSHQVSFAEADLGASSTDSIQF
jgi:hypothetical protein